VADVRRSVAAAVLVPLAALVLAGCGTISNRDEVARVGDQVLTVDMLSTAANSAAAGGPLETTTAPGNLTRNIITIWVRNAVLSQEPWFAEVDAASVLADLEADPTLPFAALDPFTQQLIIEQSVTVFAVNTGLVTVDELQAIVAAADVSIAPRYGRWNPSTAEVFTLVR
jgi:hypothetical protein